MHNILYSKQRKKLINMINNKFNNPDKLLIQKSTSNSVKTNQKHINQTLVEIYKNNPMYINLYNCENFIKIEKKYSKNNKILSEKINIIGGD